MSKRDLREEDGCEHKIRYLKMWRYWKLARRSLRYGERTLVMGVLNVTPDSFSDGGRFFSFDQAIEQTERMISEGADIIDIGGESTRPGSEFVSEDEELRRVIPVIERLASSSSVPISIDTTKSSVARAALEAGAEIVNDISGLRFDPAIADEVAKTNAGLILMHSRGTPKDMHQLPPVDDVLERSHQRPAAKRRPRRIARHFAREHGNSISASGAFAGPPRCA